MAVRQYELVYILPPETTEQQATELHDQVASVVSRMNGQIEKTENWGRRKLAYEIGRHKEGTYVLEVINGTGDLMKELDRRLRVSDQIIRHMIVRVDQEQRVIDRTPTTDTLPGQKSQRGYFYGLEFTTLDTGLQALEGLVNVKQAAERTGLSEAQVKQLVDNLKRRNETTTILRAPPTGIGRAPLAPYL